MQIHVQVQVQVQVQVAVTHDLPREEYMTRFLRMREAVRRMDLVTGPSFSSRICEKELISEVLLMVVRRVVRMVVRKLVKMVVIIFKLQEWK